MNTDDAPPWDDLSLLTDPVRRAIFDKLLQQPLHVNAIASDLPVQQPAVSQQLKKLRLAGLVQAERKGKFTVYSVSPAVLKKLSGRLEVLRDRVWRQVEPAPETKRRNEKADRIDQALDAWAAQWPRLNTLVSGIRLRLLVIGDLLKQDGERVFAKFHLNSVEFRLLALLEMKGPPYESTLTGLASFFFLSMPAISKNLASAERKQLIVRLPHAEDGRSSLLRLTDKGHQVLREVMEYQERYTYAPLYGLPDEQLELTSQVIRDLLQRLET